MSLFDMFDNFDEKKQEQKTIPVPAAETKPESEPHKTETEQTSTEQTKEFIDEVPDYEKLNQKFPNLNFGKKETEKEIEENQPEKEILPEANNPDTSEPEEKIIETKPTTEPLTPEKTIEKYFIEIYGQLYLASQHLGLWDMPADKSADGTDNLKEIINLASDIIIKIKTDNKSHLSR